MIVRALLLALLLLPPAAAHVGPVEEPPEAFCIVVIDPQEGFRLVRVTVDEDLDAAARAAAWGESDANGDGVLSAEEQQAWRLATLGFWPGGEGMGNRSLALEPGAPYARFSPVRPVYAVTWRHVGHGFYEEPESVHSGIARGEPVPEPAFETQAVREYAYHVADGVSRVTLHGGRNLTAGLAIDATREELPRPVIEYVVVKAPEGWRIRAIEGFGYDGFFRLEADNRTVELRGFDTSKPWSIHYVAPRADEEFGRIDGPAPPMVLVALLLLPLAWAARRRGCA